MRYVNKTLKQYIRDPLCENPTCLQSWLFCFLEGKGNGLLKIQPLLVSILGTIVLDNKLSKTINLYSAYTEKITSARLIDRKS